MMNSLRDFTFLGLLLIGGFAIEFASTLPTSCSDIQLACGQRVSGDYTIYPNGNQGVRAYCDLDTRGGGWTVIQRRGSQLQDRENFYRVWEDYERGFGSVTNDHWLGLQNIHLISNSANHELRIELTTWHGDREVVTYRSFNISNSGDLYRLRVDGFAGGNAGDSLTKHNGMTFSTYDKDTDGYRDGNCAEIYQGAWWYASCHVSNLNGEYWGNTKTEHGRGIQWYSWTGYYTSLRSVEMKIRSRSYDWCNNY